MLFAFHFLLAQADGQATGGGGNAFQAMLPLVAIVVLGYFLLVRPMRKQEKERQALLGAIKKNDKVVTSGGLIGIIASIKDKEDEVTLKVDESSNVRLRVTKSSIVRVISSDEAAKDKEQKEGAA